MQKGYFVALTCAALTACGGGSSDSSTTPSSEETAVIKQNTFTVKVVNRDACGNTQVNTNAQLLIHNDDFTTKAKINPSTDGSLSYETENTNEHLSVLYKLPENTDGFQPVFVKTYFEQPMKDIGELVFNTRDYNDCICQGSDFSVQIDNHYEENYVFRVDSQGYYYQASTTEGINVSNYRACQDSSGKWQPFSANIRYFPQDVSRAVYSPSLPPDTNIQADIDGVPITINVTNEIDLSELTKRAATRINGEWVFAQYAYPDIPVYFFPLPEADYTYVDALHYNNDLPQVDGVSSSYSTASHLKKFKEPTVVVDLTLPVLDAGDLMNLGLYRSQDYDFSQSGDFDFLNLYVWLIDANDDNLIVWDVYAPSSGTLPNFENIDISSMFSESKYTEITNSYINVELVGYDGINSFQDYMLDKENEWTGDDNWRSRKEYSIRMRVDDSILTSKQKTESMRQTIEAKQQVLAPKWESFLEHKALGFPINKH